MGTPTVMAARSLRLAHPAPNGARQDVELPLDHGASWRIVLRRADAREALVAQIVASGIAGLVPAGGGFLANLSLRENLLLPAQYAGAAASALEARARRLYAVLGADDGLDALLARRAEALDPLSMRRAACVRAMLCEPEVLVLDGLFDGLTPAETRVVLGFARVFHLFYPFRSVLWLDVERPGLPDAGAQRTWVLD